MNAPETSRTLQETQELSRETQEKVLESFRSLFTQGDVLNKVEAKIATMENGISKQLLMATLRRVTNITEGADKIHLATREKLDRLLARVEVTSSQSA